MSHFKIIQLSSDPVEENKTINETDIYDDPLFEQQSDWGGDTCEYDKVIHRLARELAPAARWTSTRPPIPSRSRTRTLSRTSSSTMPSTSSAGSRTPSKRRPSAPANTSSEP